MRKNKLQKTAQNRTFSRFTKRAAVGALSLAMAGMMILPLTGCENTGKPGTTEESSKNAGGKTEEDQTDPENASTQDTKENTSDSTEESKTESETESATEVETTPEAETTPEETPEPTPEPNPTPEPTPTPVPITFTDDLALVYAIKDVNIRKEPSTASSDLVVGVLAEGEMIQRTGISEEWTRVSMEGNDYYIKSEFLTTEKPEPSSEAAENTPTPIPTPAGGEGGTVTNGYTTYTASTNGFTVCIDPGHQAHGMSEMEPNGPGSSEMKAKLTTGTAGVATGLAEHELNLKVSLKLKQELINRGYGVVMIRETADCPVSNMERALISNASGANIYVRVHGNSIADPAVAGTTAFAPSPSNPYVGSLSADSVRLSANIVDSMCALTGFQNRSVSYSDTMTGTNWSTIPVTIVEMGFMSNPTEDAAMATEEYQNLMAKGMADGIDKYFGR